MATFVCPQCGKTGSLSSPDTTNDNEDFVTMEAPEGFRKVQYGARSNTVHLYCVRCGVPAVRPGPRA